MTLAKTTEIPKIAIVNDWNIEVATDTVIKEDSVELSRSRHRHVLTPFQSNYDDENKKWVHTATDISGEASNVQAICNAVWTDTVKANYKTFVESQET
mgnify:CR=1 FL=1|tara:strand:- start:255 stop:548 length:294 start_codon:yes stop_codon:yes gene_type:complete